MKILLLYCLISSFGILGWAQNGFEKKTIQILPNSELTIKGDTNISKFKCVFNTAHLEKTRDIEYRKSDNHISFKNAVLKLKIKVLIVAVKL